MYKIPENTLFTGKNLVYVPQCHSTNVLAAELGQKIETLDGTLVITDHQTSGRGQRGNKWESQPGKNLTFSLIFKPFFLAVKDQFKLNEAVSNGIADYVTKKVAEKVHIKWPNDILVQDKKICGMLIENHLSGEEIIYSVVGIGLNVNQLFFPHLQAGSLKACTGMEYELAHELTELLGEVEARYLQLRRGSLSGLEESYLQRLYRKDEIHSFSAEGKVFDGMITGVSDAGQLQMNIGAETRLFGVKEVTFL